MGEPSEGVGCLWVNWTARRAPLSRELGPGEQSTGRVPEPCQRWWLLEKYHAVANISRASSTGRRYHTLAMFETATVEVPI